MELSRSIAYHPQTESINLRLSVKMIINYADDIWLSDEALSTAITVFLKKYKSELFYNVSPKKHNLKMMMHHISLECSLTQEVDKVKM